jgi:hydroxymethylbilane synthase
MKDMTAHIQPELVLGAYMTREDPRDALLGPSATIAGLPEGAVLGTSSLRRKAQVLAIRPDLHVVQFRGNVETRLRKLMEGVADATLLAAAGLNRLGLIDRAAGIVGVDEILPAGAQGIVGVTIRSDAAEWIVKAVAAADDADARLAGVAERAFLRRLDGSCRTPIAAHFSLHGSGFWMAGEVLSDDGRQRWRAQIEIDQRPNEQEAEFIGRKLGDEVAQQREKDLGPA